MSDVALSVVVGAALVVVVTVLAVLVAQLHYEAVVFLEAHNQIESIRSQPPAPPVTLVVQAPGVEYGWLRVQPWSIGIPVRRYGVLGGE